MQDHIVTSITSQPWGLWTSFRPSRPTPRRRLDCQSVSDWPGNSEKEFSDVQKRLKAFVDSGKLGIFASGYWGHPAMILPPEINLIATAHYLKALDYQQKAAQAVAILGGKNPHIQNLCVGGVATALNMDNLATINMERIAYLKALMTETREFVKKVYYPDLLVIGKAYKDWFKHGKGVVNYLAVPEFAEDTKNTSFALPGGLILGGDVAKPA